MMHLLAKPSLEEVFKSTSENMGSSADPKAIYAFLLGGAALVLLLVLISSRKKREAAPRAVNHHGKLLKEILRRIPLKGGEVKQLKVIAGEQGLSSPLLLVLCPSLLAKGVAAKTKADKRVILRVARKMGVLRKAEPAETQG